MPWAWPKKKKNIISSPEFPLSPLPVRHEWYSDIWQRRFILFVFELRTCELMQPERFSAQLSSHSVTLWDSSMPLSGATVLFHCYVAFHGRSRLPCIGPYYGWRTEDGFLGLAAASSNAMYTLVVHMKPFCWGYLGWHCWLTGHMYVCFSRRCQLSKWQCQVILLPVTCKSSICSLQQRQIQATALTYITAVATPNP